MLHFFITKGLDTLSLPVIFSSVEYLLIFALVDSNRSMIRVTNEMRFEYLGMMLLYVEYHYWIDLQWQTEAWRILGQIKNCICWQRSLDHLILISFEIPWEWCPSPTEASLKISSVSKATILCSRKKVTLLEQPSLEGKWVFIITVIEEKEKRQIDNTTWPRC